MGGIFVVEDDTDFREAVVDMLAEAGYGAVGFADAEAALDRLAALRPALVILDLVLPRMDGADFLARLRASRDGAQVPVLIVSGLGEGLLGAIDPLRAGDEGIRGVIAKPVQYANLIAHVEGILGPPRGRAGS